MRKNILILFVTTFILLSTTTSFATVTTPIDVQLNWASIAENTLIQNGVMSGYDNGRFKPSKTITREQASIVLYNSAKVKGELEPVTTPDNTTEPAVYASNIETEVTTSYKDYTVATDVTHNWLIDATKYVNYNKIIDNYPDNLFHGNYSVTREQLAYIIYNYYKSKDLLNSLTPIRYSTFTDINNSYAKTPITTLYNAGIINGFSDKEFNPTGNVSRAEFATLIMKISEFEPVNPQITLPTYKVLDVPYISQCYPVHAPVGCEPTSLLMGLHAKGYSTNVDLTTFLNAMPKTISNPAKGFVGSPYVADPTKKTRTTIYPDVLANWSKAYGNVEDFSGSSIQELRAELLAGNPVVCYMTLWWEKPFYRWYNIEGQQQYLLSNNHALLACGYDSNTNMYYVSDPYNKKDTSNELKYWVSGSTFEKIYNERKHAVVVR